MKIEIDVDANEAEEILIALWHRECQMRNIYIGELGESLANTFHKAGMFDNEIWKRITRNRVKVTVKPL